MSEKSLVLEWLFDDDTGISSKDLAACFLGVNRSPVSPPRDPSDLGRCLRLIKIVPSVRQCVDELAHRHREWAKAAACWNAISASMDEEVGIDWSKGDCAPRTYQLMKEAGL